MRVALLEDDQTLSDVVRGWLQEEGHMCLAYANGKDIVRAASRESFDLVILDWVVPGMDGRQVLERLRETLSQTVPVLFVTARDAEDDIVSALEAGADDYMVKPVRRREFLSRLNALWRRSQPHGMDPEPFDIGGLHIDPVRRTIHRGVEAIELTEKEFDLAYFVLRQPGKLLSRNHILEAVWGKSGNVQTRTIDTHMSRLRVKLGLRPDLGLRLSAVHSVGYRLEAARDDQ